MCTVRIQQYLWQQLYVQVTAMEFIICQSMLAKIHYLRINNEAQRKETFNNNKFQTFKNYKYKLK